MRDSEVRTGAGTVGTGGLAVLSSPRKGERKCTLFSACIPDYIITEE